ncbi:hypothetical protein HY491_00135 [Candidatus Woesearchaeota archaeon]|nr:hypothetical protein [Candidatus Woesearchaeota archaeon]
MISSLTDQSSISDIFLYAANPTDLTPNGLRSEGEYAYAQALLHDRYCEEMRHLEELMLLIVQPDKRMNAARYRDDRYDYRTKDQLKDALHLLQPTMDNRPETFIDQLRTYHRWYISKKRKAKVQRSQLEWEEERKVQLCRYTGIYRRRFLKRNIPERERPTDINFLIGMHLTDLRRKLYVQRDANSSLPYHNFYVRVKGVSRATDKFLKRLAEAQARHSGSYADLQPHEYAVWDVMGIKVIALEWGGTYARFDTMVYSKLREAGWAVLEYPSFEDPDKRENGKKDFRNEPDKTLGFVRYYLQRVDDPATVISVQYTTLTDYFLDEFFSEDSHFRHVNNPNRIGPGTATHLRRTGKSRKKLEDGFPHTQNHVRMQARLSRLCRDIYDTVPDL